jgi:hypothetical protein
MNAYDPVNLLFGGMIRKGAMTSTHDPRAAFIEASVWQGSRERADAILAAHPEVASSDICTAALVNDADGVRRVLALDPASAMVKGEPSAWDALTHLCFSKYLRLDRTRSDGFVQAATGWDRHSLAWRKTGFSRWLLSQLG